MIVAVLGAGFIAVAVDSSSGLFNNFAHRLLGLFDEHHERAIGGTIIGNVDGFEPCAIYVAKQVILGANCGINGSGIYARLHALTLTRIRAAGPGGRAVRLPSSDTVAEFYGAKAKVVGLWGSWDAIIAQRSEEHTSELQSRGHLVCRLLLEKKKYSINY